MERAAESMTNEDFIALTSLDNGKGFLPVEARIRDTHKPISIIIQRLNDDVLEYTLAHGNSNYSGRFNIKRNKDGTNSPLTLNEVDGFRVMSRQLSKNRQEFFYRNGKTDVKLTHDELRRINYWVPTAINHFSLNANNFLVGLKEFHEQNPGQNPNNIYCLVVTSDGDGTHKSPSHHYRRGYTKSIEIGGRELTIGISGTYVNADWTKFTTAQIVEDLARNSGGAGGIAEHHFNRSILPAIAGAGHPLDAIKRAYSDGRTKKEDGKPAIIPLKPNHNYVAA